jgi:hypothetical protein
MRISYVHHDIHLKSFANRIPADPDEDSRIWLCADSAHERAPMGILLHLLCVRCLQLRQVPGEGEFTSTMTIHKFTSR